MKQIKILTEIKKIEDQILSISQDIHRRPELGNQEIFAHNRICTYLEEQGWYVERELKSLPTAFIARYGIKEKPAIGFLAEYDALPNIGHACGHNLICAASVGAAIALSRVFKENEVCIKVIGTPAEETTGGKITLLRDGYFHGLDAVMMFHPGVSNIVNFSCLALEALEVKFYGQSGHAAVLNQKSGDSIEALLQLFFWVNLWKKRLSHLCQINGIIKEGGNVPNIRPERTVARFYLRAATEAKLDDICKEFVEETYKIADKTGTIGCVTPFEARYQPFKSNVALAKVFIQSMKRLGVDCPSKSYQGVGSMDIGNVSHVVPAIHPYLTLDGGPKMLHTKEFEMAAGGEWGDKLTILGAKALALTGMQLFENERIISRAWDEFNLYHGKKMLS